MTTKSVKLPANMHPIQGVCAKEDGQYQSASVHLEGDLALATNGKMLAAVRGAVVEESPDMPFPPWRDVVPNPKGMRFVALNPRLLLELAESLMRGDDNGVIIGVPKRPEEAILVLSMDKERDALGVLMPIKMDRDRSRFPEKWAPETVERVTKKPEKKPC